MDDKTPIIGENELKNIKDKLEKKMHVSTSQDGAFSLTYTGDRNYKKVKINKELYELSKEELEKDIMDMIQYSKNQIQADFAEIMMGFSEEDERDELDTFDDSMPGDRRDVS